MRPRISPGPPSVSVPSITHHSRPGAQLNGGPGIRPTAVTPWRGAVQRCSWLVLLVAVLACLPTSSAADGETNDIGACLSSDQVWLLVMDADGAVLANQCVGTPGDGETALREGGMAIGRGRSDLVCTLDGHPEQCPRTFTGEFWHYYYSFPGEGYDFADLGPRARTPRPGTIEAWCYNAQDERKCTPPELSIVVDGVQLNSAADLIDPETTSNEPVSGASGSPIALAGTVAALVVGGAGFWWWQRRHRALL